MFKLFKHKHKWTYAELVRDECKNINVRYCKCGQLQHWKFSAGLGMIWGNALFYTDAGAKAAVDGYGEE